jgi:hypothetical protein
MITSNLLRLLIALPLLLIFLSNCGTITRTSVLVSESDSIKIGYNQLKVLLVTFYETFSNTTEQSANDIIYTTQDDDIKKMALRWKINTIAEARTSLSLGDPFASLIDMRAYCYQLNQFFVSGAGKDYFGEFQYIAIKTSEFLVKEIDKIVLQAISRAKFENNQEEFLEWVSSNPILGPEFSRKSTISLFVEYIGDDTKNLSSSLGSIEEALTDIRSRLTLYSQSLPKQAQWQTELIIEENMQRNEIKRTLSDLDTIAASLTQINQFLQDVDLLLGSVLNDSFSEINRQRLATIGYLKSERELLVNLLQSERQTLLDAVSLEREKTINDAQRITDGIMSQSSIMIYDIVDHIFYRILQLFAILAVVVFVSIIILRRYKRV